MAIAVPAQRAATPPRPVRRRSSGVQTRAEIVAAAERHFAEVGIRRAAIFYHFGDKHELYAAVLDEIYGRWMEFLPSEGSAVERLEASLTGWIDYVAERPSVARLILREAASARPGVVSTFVRAGSAPVAWFRTLIDEGMASGELKPRIEPHRFISLMGAITVFHFAAMPWLTLEAPFDPWSRAELDKHKREILIVARGMLGIEPARKERERS